MKNVRVKICGITNHDDMMSAVNAGADALGFVFYNQSKRAVTVDHIQSVVKSVPSFVSIVGLFVNPEREFVNHVLSAMPIDELQFHGNESADFCRQFNRRYLKAVPMKLLLSKENAQKYIEHYPDTNGLLFDAFGGDTQGGSGEIFNWNELPTTDKPIIIAGGLNVNNIDEVITKIHPYGIDVSSGVEIHAGKKSSDKMIEFVAKVKALYE